ncbi:MAG: SLC13 family permease [Candidatus Izemoplasmatales bacterium]|nr:SLC13 family permease [Candidatus Izemoplasmatales bacterium]MDY0372568.1 SLC13 family permease [Candidatus Izemoplasmatales bacterium]
MKATLHYFWRDKVFVIAMIFALISLMFFPPTIDTFHAINPNVLVIMFSLMIAVSGMTEANLFSKIAIFLTSRFFTVRYVGLAIIIATFFMGMLLTNDAVLLTLVPFSLFVMRQTDNTRYSLTIVILMTFAANMGSALTPMGDPQNIFLYQFYNLDFGEFLLATLPIALSAFVLIIAVTCALLPNRFIKPVMISPKVDQKRVAIGLIIFILVLLLIIRIIPPWVVFAGAFLLTISFYPHLFKKVDYPLLLTFVSFFILTHNLGNWTWLMEKTQVLLKSPWSVYLSALGFSQVMSNVPASVLLATFTEKTYWRYLLQGVNVGSMGSIIASLASLITFKFVIREFPSQMKAYLQLYTTLGLIFMGLISLLLVITNGI